MLFLVATPIGNLRDITFRAIDTLKACDYILCEDTRHSLPLLTHYDIKKPLKSYHKFNEQAQLDNIIEDLRLKKNIALISDAGTPGISDPGEILVKKCIEEGIPITAIPGPCAAIQALTCSGLPTAPFQFCGFLPKKEGELHRTLTSLLQYKGTLIFYESPHRILDVLQKLEGICPERMIVVGRELTKKFEELVRGSARDLLNHWTDTTPKGEIVLLIAPFESKGHEWEQLTPQEHVNLIQESYNVSKQEAIKIAAELRGVPKRMIYNEVNKKLESLPD